MGLIIEIFTLGPLSNNTYYLSDTETNQSVIIDPGQGSSEIIPTMINNFRVLTGIWLTHGHFDHYLGVRELTDQLDSEPVIGIHKDDLDLWKTGGGSAGFGFTFDPGPEPKLLLEDQQVLPIGCSELKVLHTPGHSLGHVVFYSEAAKVVFCGDLIFKYGIGRTDLPGGSMTQILNSIKTKIFSLPDDTRLLPGHGPETTIIQEKTGNPYIS